MLTFLGRKATQGLKKVRSGHILISGTGRAGTTLLVQLFTFLGLDTGYTKQAALEKVDAIAHAGLECSLKSKKLPYVAKSPWFCDQIEDALREGLKVGVMIIPMRDLGDAARSRIRVFKEAEAQGKDPRRNPGTIWKTESPEQEQQETHLAMQFYKLVEPLVRHEVPIIFLGFPRFALDADYFYATLKPVFDSHGIGRETVLSVHKQLARPKLIGSAGPAA